jgi:Cu2+-exporting ATPase
MRRSARRQKRSADPRSGAFERARDLTAAVFDKTGTLTEGRFGVSDIVVPADGNEAEELRFAASAESQSEHPIAQGIVTAAKECGIAGLCKTIS